MLEHQNGIVRTVWGFHIDLDKIVYISDAYFIDKMGFGGYFVGFDILFQILDEKFHYRREFNQDEYNFIYERSKHELVYNKQGNILAVARLQREVSDLIRLWIQYKFEKLKSDHRRE